MGEPAFTLEIQKPPPDGVRVFRLNDHEWWAGETLQDAIAAAGRLWGIQGEALAESTEGAYVLNDADLDTTHLIADEEGTRLSFREALEAMKSEGVCFPHFFAGIE